MVIWYYMQTQVKTTVSLPGDLIQRAKITAVEHKLTLSHLIRKGLEKEIDFYQSAPLNDRTMNPLRHLGIYKIGIQRSYKKRADIYEKLLKRNLGA